MRQFLIAALLAALPAVPVLGATETERTGLSAIDLFKLAEERQRDGRPEEALALYDALSRDPHPEIRAEARFRKGQLLASEGRYTDAAVSYRALLDEKPDAAAVRLELARVLALAGEERGADVAREIEPVAAEPAATPAAESEARPSPASWQPAASFEALDLLPSREKLRAFS